MLPTDPLLRDLIRLQIEQLESRLAEDYLDLRERLDDLRHHLESLTGAVLARLEAHEDYHRRNEHRWGLYRLAARHPFRFAALAGAAAVVAASLGAGWADLVLRLLLRLGPLLP